MMKHDFVTVYPLSLVSPDRRSLEGLLGLDAEHDTLTLEYAGNRLEVADEDYFEAFCRIRERLEADGLRPVCYGASRNVYP